MRTRHNHETTNVTVKIVFTHLTTQLHPIVERVEVQDWTKHGLAEAVSYASTYFDRANAHEYMRLVELVCNGEILASYTTDKPQPEYLRPEPLCTCAEFPDLHKVSVHK
jgi:hypothetical protein